MPRSTRGGTSSSVASISEPVAPAPDLPADKAICVGWLTDILKSRQSWYAIDIRTSSLLYISEEPTTVGVPFCDMRDASVKSVSLRGLQVLRLSSPRIGNVYLWTADATEMQAWVAVLKRASSIMTPRASHSTSDYTRSATPSTHTNPDNVGTGPRHHSSTAQKEDNQVRVETLLPSACNVVRKIQIYATQRRIWCIGEVPADITQAPGAHVIDAPRYRVLEFDRTIQTPSTLSEIMREHEDTYDVTTIHAFIAAIYAGAGLPVPDGVHSPQHTYMPSKVSTPTVPEPTFARESKTADTSSHGSNFFSSWFAQTPKTESPQLTVPEPERLLAMDVAAMLGVIRFTKGYYIVVVPRRQKAGTIGDHSVYAVASTDMLSIYCDTVSTATPRTLLQSLQDRLVSTDAAIVLEGRYQSLFLNFDLAKDCYYSYTYDMTRPLQQQTAVRVYVGKTLLSEAPGAPEQPEGETNFGDDRRWNWYLASQLTDAGASPCWCPRLVHGFFRQVHTSVFGRPLLISLLARRSRHFAGTRFLKRGINEEGYVANDVETEQIADDTQGHFAAFVQIRGSIPVFWMQRTNLTVPKPPIILHPRDISYEATKRHIADVFEHYGAPLCVVNLVKKKEKHDREKLIGREFGRAMFHINAELPPELRVQYLALDYTSLVKSKRYNILAALRDVGKYIGRNTGIFCTHSRLPGMHHRRYARQSDQTDRKSGVEESQHVLPHVCACGNLAHTQSSRKATQAEHHAADVTTVPATCISADELINTFRVENLGYVQYFDGEQLLRPFEASKHSATHKVGASVHAEGYTSRVNNPFVTKPQEQHAAEASRSSHTAPVCLKAVYAGAFPIDAHIQSALTPEPSNPAATVTSPNALSAQVNYSRGLYGVGGPLVKERFDRTANNDHASTKIDWAEKAMAMSTRSGVPYFAGLCSLHQFSVVALDDVTQSKTSSSESQQPTSTQPAHSHTTTSGVPPLFKPLRAQRSTTTEQTATTTTTVAGGVDNSTAKLSVFPLRRFRINAAPLRPEDTAMIQSGLELYREETLTLCADIAVRPPAHSDVTTDDGHTHEDGKRGRTSTGWSASSSTFHTIYSSPGHTASAASHQHRLTHQKPSPPKHAKRAKMAASAMIARRDIADDSSEHFMHCRTVGEASKAAGLTHAVVCCTAQQDATAHSADGTVKSGLAARLKQYEVIAGSANSLNSDNEYLYMNVVGTTHGFHNDGKYKSPSKQQVLQHLEHAMATASPQYWSNQTATVNSSGVATYSLPAPLILPQLGLRLQSGVPRINCVDCMDRTNVAQVCIGVHMFGLQLYSLGIIDTEELDATGTLKKELMTMYEEMGDSIAIQYGGSEANKKVTTAEHAESTRAGAELDGEAPDVSASGKTSDDKSFWGFLNSATAQTQKATRVSRLGGNSATELLSSLQRYYANSFTDSVKQAAMNLLLGKFRPFEHNQALWELESDQYLHNATLASPQAPVDIVPLGRDWWSDPMASFLRNGFPKVDVLVRVSEINAYNHLRRHMLGPAVNAPLYRPPTFSARNLSLLGSIPVSITQFEHTKLYTFEDLLRRSYLQPHASAVPMPYKQRTQHAPIVPDTPPSNPVSSMRQPSDMELFSGRKDQIYTSQPLKRALPHAATAAKDTRAAPTVTLISPSSKGVVQDHTGSLFADVLPVQEENDFVDGLFAAVTVSLPAGVHVPQSFAASMPSTSTSVEIPKWLAPGSVEVQPNGAVCLTSSPKANNNRKSLVTAPIAVVEETKTTDALPRDNEAPRVVAEEPAQPRHDNLSPSTGRENSLNLTKDAFLPEIVDPFRVFSTDMNHVDRKLFDRYAALGKAGGLWIGNDVVSTAGGAKAHIITSPDQAQLFRQNVFGSQFHPDDMKSAAAWQASHGLTVAIRDGPFAGLQRDVLASSILGPLTKQGVEDPLYALYVDADVLNAPVEPVTCIYVGAAHAATD